MGSVRVHGGTDAAGPVRWDFSTNINAAGPCPQVLQAVAQADVSRYPDPRYTALRERLAAWHGVTPARVLFAASASEFIQRVTAVGQRLAPGPVALPALAYGDYAIAALACGRSVLIDGDAFATAPTMRWCADPSSPLGQVALPPTDPEVVPTVLDAAYEPLRLGGGAGWPQAARDAVFQLHTPNKALGLPGVRGAYVIAPARTDWPVTVWCAALEQAEPSWPLGAHAVALLDAWTQPFTQDWLASTRHILERWTAVLRDGLAEIGLQPQPSVTPFLCALRPAAATDVRLRAHGLKVRDTASFGLPGQMRVSAQPPAATQALLAALAELAHHPTRSNDLDPRHPRTR
jgi:histidinol-phosphate aminotransferase